jgi:hypothetical protein
MYHYRLFADREKRRVFPTYAAIWQLPEVSGVCKVEWIANPSKRHRTARSEIVTKVVKDGGIYSGRSDTADAAP